MSLVFACITQHASDMVELLGIFQEILGNEFCPQWIARHQYRLGDLAYFGRIMWCTIKLAHDFSFSSGTMTGCFLSMIISICFFFLFA